MGCFWCTFRASARKKYGVFLLFWGCFGGVFGPFCGFFWGGVFFLRDFLFVCFFAGQRDFFEGPVTPYVFGYPVRFLSFGFLGRNFGILLPRTFFTPYEYIFYSIRNASQILDESFSPTAAGRNNEIIFAHSPITVKLRNFIFSPTRPPCSLMFHIYRIRLLSDFVRQRDFLGGVGENFL